MPNYVLLGPRPYAILIAKCGCAGFGCGETPRRRRRDQTAGIAGMDRPAAALLRRISPVGKDAGRAFRIRKRGRIHMSRIKNEPKHKNGILQAIREQLEHRAMWLYLLCDEAGKKGLKWEDFGCEAVRRCGCFQGAGLVKKGGTDSLKGLKKTLFTKPAQLVFEMKIRESEDDRLSIDFHYCPLVKAWQKQGCTDEEIERLCDMAMCGDRGIASAYGARLELPKTIARGDDICEIRFKKGLEKEGEPS